MFFNGTRYTSFIDFKTAISQSDTITANPLLKDVAAADCYLQPGSPCIGAGIDVGLVVDYNGNQVPKINGLVVLVRRRDGCRAAGTRTGVPDVVATTVSPPPPPPPPQADRLNMTNNATSR